MQESGMCRIHRVFQDLQPIARIKVFLSRNEPVSRPGKAVIHREWRTLLGRAHIGEHDARVLMGWIGAVAQPVLQRAAGRLAWGLEDFAIGRKQPSMVATTDALSVDQAK